MRRILAVLLLLSASAFADKVRIGDNLPFQTTAVINGTTVIVPVTDIVSIQICAYPANAVPCTNKVTTYSDVNGASCGSSTQVVLAGTTTCVAGADALGNWGAWTDSQSIAVTAQRSGGSTIGPIPVTANASPNTNAWSSLTASTANTIVSQASNTTDFTYSGLSSPSGPIFQWNGSTTTGIGISPIDSSLDLNIPQFGGFNPVNTNQAYLGIGFTGISNSSLNKIVGWQTSGGATIQKLTVGQTAGVAYGICQVACNSLVVYSVVAIAGTAQCAFDGATTAADWVVVSSTVAGDCHDSGSASPPATSVTTIGRVLTTNGVAGTYPVSLQISR